MLPVTADFDDAIANGAVVDVYGLIERNFEQVVDEPVRFVQGGTVNVDEAAGSVRQLNAGIADPEGILRPLVATDPLAPYGSELALRIGVRLPTGKFEYVDAGVYRLEVTGGQAGDPVPVRGGDRSVVVAAARHEQPWVIAGGTPLGDAVVDMLAVKYPGLPVEIEPSAFTEKLPFTSTVFLPGDIDGDPWSNLRKLCADRGRRITMNASGTARVELVPDFTDPSKYVTVREYVAGRDDNLAIIGSLVLDTTTGIYNVWVASGQADPPVTASAEVTDPVSPLFPAGGFGRRPTFIVSQYLTTTAQCQAAADAAKATAADPSRQTSFIAIPHPGHEPSDVVRYKSERLGVDAIVVLSSWSLPIDLLAETTYKTRRVL